MTGAHHLFLMPAFWRCVNARKPKWTKANDTLCASFPGLAEFKANKAIDIRHKKWAEAMALHRGERIDLSNSLRRSKTRI